MKGAGFSRSWLLLLAIASAPAGGSPQRRGTGAVLLPAAGGFEIARVLAGIP